MRRPAASIATPSRRLPSYGSMHPILNHSNPSPSPKQGRARTAILQPYLYSADPSSSGPYHPTNASHI
ncbi:hypothetical protein M011DRAFT_472435 [Sporormia fimetaria CBS 119925]|uniref:Uncharacterized protein n=1 Tax=Sporormia fimetaria CBS 119925 TaxID=1340428 RepID=A0A6A6UXS3_9PLEO|nr:hypothetical protein M011DRAFT_472435 [Sporormia fimetaria CBS 119925]